MRRSVLIPAVLALALVAPEAHAERWLGLFEGHGFAPPADAKRARAALVAVRRATVECYELYYLRAGGVAAGTGTCGDMRAALSRSQDDAVSAIFDELDRANLGEPSFQTLLSALASTGRADVVPVLVTALERMNERSALDDVRVREAGRTALVVIDEALRSLTFASPAPGQYSIWNVKDEEVAGCAQAWRTWLTAHPKLDRAAWKAAAIAAARAKLAGPDAKAAADGALELVSIPDTRAEGIAALRALPTKAFWPKSSPPIDVTEELKRLTKRRR